MSSVTLCRNFIENRCKNRTCPRVHDTFHQKEYKTRQIELVKAYRKNGDTEALCYTYSTGANCIQHVLPAKCRYKHDLEVRRAITKSLGRKSLLEVFISEKVHEIVKAVSKTTPNKSTNTNQIISSKKPAGSISQPSIANVGSSSITSSTINNRSDRKKNTTPAPTDNVAAKAITPSVSRAPNNRKKNASPTSTEKAATSSIPSPTAITPVHRKKNATPASIEGGATTSVTTSTAIVPYHRKNSSTPPSIENTVMSTSHRRKRNGHQKPDIVPYPEDDRDKDCLIRNGGLVLLKGNWERTPAWKMSIRSIERYNELRSYTEYMEGIEAGHSPESMISKVRKAAPHCEFRNFSLFPYEIREMIWKYAVASHKHDVRLKFQYKMEFGQPVNIKIRHRNCGPPLLRVNRECREIALPRYEKLFGTTYSKPKIMFDRRVDRISFDLCHPYELYEMLPYISPVDAGKVRHMKVPMFDFIKHDEMKISDTISFFRNIRTLTIIFALTEDDRKVFTPSYFKYHSNGIRACIATSWRRKYPLHRRGPPLVRFEELDLAEGTYLKVSNLIW